VRQAEGSLELCPVDDVAEALAIAASEALDREGSIGVIAADRSLAALSKSLRAAGVAHSVLGADENEAAGGVVTDGAAADGAASGDEAQRGAESAPPRLVLVPASLAKGLEYDQVIVAEPADIVDAEYSELLGLRRLYVVLTRAVSRLTVLHVRPLPAQLAAQPMP
jgi:hypothetical protein